MESELTDRVALNPGGVGDGRPLASRLTHITTRQAVAPESGRRGFPDAAAARPPQDDLKP